jgi:hypothetical protein
MQNYENAVNQISPGRLQHIAQVLQVTPPFFFEGLPVSTEVASSPFPDYVNELLATRNGLDLIAALSLIENRNMRRAIVDFVEQIEPE